MSLLIEKIANGYLIAPYAPNLGAVDGSKIYVATSIDGFSGPTVTRVLRDHFETPPKPAPSPKPPKELIEALEWALSVMGDDLDPDHIEAIESAQAALKNAKGE